MTVAWHEYCYRWTCPHCDKLTRQAVDADYSPKCDHCGKQVQFSRIVFSTGVVCEIQRRQPDLRTAADVEPPE